MIQHNNIDSLVKQISSYLRKKTGIVLSPLQEKKLSIKVQTGEISSNILDEKDVFSPHFQNLIKLITVEESYFFRYPKQFLVLKDILLREIIPRKKEKGKKSVTILSIGCARGEEVYTVALITDEVLNVERDFEFFVVGSDINLEHLKTAQSLLYTSSSLRLLSENEKKKYFEKIDNRYKFNVKLKTKTSFLPINAVDFKTFPVHLSPFDVIFFRNVLIYMAPEHAQKVLKNVLSVLNEEGYLFLGHADFIDNASPELLKIQEGGLYIFKKIHPASLRPKIAPVVQTKDFKMKKEIVERISPSFIFEKLLSLFKKDSFEQLEKEMEGIDINSFREEEKGKILFIKSYILLQKGNTEEARIILEELSQNTVLLPEVYYLLGFIQMEKGDINAAEKNFLKAVYLNDRFVPAYIGLFNICAQTRRKAEGERYRKKLMRFASGEIDGDFGLLKSMPLEDLKKLAERG